MSVEREELISQCLLDSSTVSMAVNGASAAATYGYTVPEFSTFLLTRGLLVIEDGNTAFAPGNFGAIVGPLSNGIEISYTTKAKGKIIIDNWKTNRQIRDTMFDFDQTFKSDGVYTGRWTFSKDLATRGLFLYAGDKFEIKIQDDLSTLDYLSFKLKGNLTVTE